MPPRYTYWTIIAGGLPTAFRAAERDELLPTFTRIKHKHPDAELKWFARGKLWDSPESARRDAERRRTQEVRPQPGRGRDWRPGGEHRDPRQKYQDAKKARNVEQRKRKFERRHRSGGDWERAGNSERSATTAWRRPRVAQKSFARNRGTDESPAPPRPQRPPREPHPREGSEPPPPPRPTEPITAPPGPPERGRRKPPKRYRR
jgi:hypothetical protein